VLPNRPPWRSPWRGCCTPTCQIGNHGGCHGAAGALLHRATHAPLGCQIRRPWRRPPACGWHTRAPHRAGRGWR
jgi:hypothetical protein